MSRFFIAIVLSSFMALAKAVALVKNKADEDISVNIICPDIGSSWIANTIEIVEWEIPDPCFYPHNATIDLVFGYVDAEGEHLCPKTLLAKDALVHRGFAHITVPCVRTAIDYIVAVKGNPTDSSQQFKIFGCSSKTWCP